MPAHFAAQRLHARELFLQPQARRDQHLVVATAAGVDAAAGVAEAFGEARFDRGMAVLEAFVEHERAAAEILRQRRSSRSSPASSSAVSMPMRCQALRMRAARGDVVQEEFAIEQHVVAREEGLDLRVDL